MNAGMALFGPMTWTSVLFIPLKPLLMKDLNSRVYNKFAFLFGTFIIQIPYWLIYYTSIAISIFFIFGLNFNPMTNLIWFLAFVWLGLWGGLGLGLYLAVFGNDLHQIVAITPMITLLCIQVSGLFIGVLDMSWPSRIISYVNPLRYVYQGFSLNEYRERDRFLANCRITYDCVFDPKLQCRYPAIPGTSMIEYCDPAYRFNFEQKQLWESLIIGIAVGLFWGILGCILYAIKYKTAETIYSSDPELYDLYKRNKTDNENKTLIKHVENDPSNF